MQQADEPPVSVVIPAFNGGHFIAEAIDSALAQDYRNIEIVVIDDGSTDNTPAIVRRYGDKVRYFSQANQGAAAARNLGIRNARGKYVAFLDADDCWWNRKLSYQIQSLRQTAYKMAYSRFIWWKQDPDGRYRSAEQELSHAGNPNLSTCAVVTGWNYADLLLDCNVWTSTVLVEKTELEAAGGFDVSLRKGQDYDMWLRLSRRVEMLGLQKPTALYRIHADSITGAVKDVNYEYSILDGAVRRWGLAGPDRRSAPADMVSARLARIMLGHGWTHYTRGSARIASSAFRESMKHSGIRPKPVALYILSKLKSVFQS